MIIYTNFPDRKAYCQIYLLALQRPCSKEHFGESLHCLMFCQRSDYNFCEGQVLKYRLLSLYNLSLKIAFKQNL